MKQRLPTPEERRLWRESNRHTSPTKDADIPDDDAAIDSASPAPTKHTAVPPASSAPKTPRTPPPLATLSARAATRHLKSHAIDATLDLHGLTKIEAHTQVHRFLAQCVRRGRRHVLIITGKGRGGEEGVLRSNLPHWLNEPALRPLISAMATAKPEKGGAGALHVLLKAAR